VNELEPASDVSIGPLVRLPLPAAESCGADPAPHATAKKTLPIRRNLKPIDTYGVLPVQLHDSAFCAGLRLAKMKE
jgi:hypothetical protein